jgi:hypothetical protein
VVRRQPHTLHLVERLAELHLHFVDLLGIVLLRLGEVKVVDVLAVEALDPLRNYEGPVKQLYFFILLLVHRLTSFLFQRVFKFHR